jgi:hypothetical protein
VRFAFDHVESALFDFFFSDFLGQQELPDGPSVEEQRAERERGSPRLITDVCRIKPLWRLHCCPVDCFLVGGNGHYRPMLGPNRKETRTVVVSPCAALLSGHS